MKKAMIALATIGLSGCVTTTAQTPPERSTVLTPPDAVVCNADPVQIYVGQRADQAVGAAILKASGARTLRWGPPRSAWTMDFRQDRVNVEYDAGMIIERITCG